MHFPAILHAVRSLIDLHQYLFQQKGVEYILTARINQDPLEKFFGLQRQKGGASDNPNVDQFYKNTQALRVINTVSGNIRGNVRGTIDNLTAVKTSHYVKESGTVRNQSEYYIMTF